MNKIHCVVWNLAINAWQVVGESVRRSKTSRTLGSVLLAISSGAALAIDVGTLPSGASISSGSAAIVASPHQLEINQVSDKASINWSSFSIGSSASVRFNQPSASSITLNRITGSERSVIDGAMSANGQVWLLNSNGILFNSTASVNTAGLIASTLEMSDSDFANGEYRFTDSLSTASVLNMGQIDISQSGYAALLAPNVDNEGSITAIKGSVHLTGASEATINLNGNSLINLTVDKGVLDALVHNKGAVIADGGEIYLTTNAVDDLLAGVVNNTGILQARTFEEAEGTIIGFAHGGSGQYAGVIDASAPFGGDGGFIETSGTEVTIHSDARITTQSATGKTGTWLLDPTDITIVDGGSDGIAGASIDAQTVETALASNNVVLDASNDIFIDESINSTTNNSLTFKAGRNITLEGSRSVLTAGGDVIFWADSDNNEVGAIRTKTGSAINTNGGDITLGGGLDPSTDYAVANAAIGVESDKPSSGVALFAMALDADGGDILINGSNGSLVASTRGVYAENSTIQTSGTGTITINGDGGTSTGATNPWGVTLGSTTVQTDSGDISITGISNRTNANNERGVVLSGYVQSLSGDIYITDETTSATQSNYATHFNGIYLPVSIGKGTLASSQSNIYIRGNEIQTETSTVINTTGVTEITPYTGQPTFTNTLTWNGVTAASEITIGQSTNTANVVISGDQISSGDMTIYSQGTVTQDAGDTLNVAGVLSLLGTGGAYTLTDSGNDSGTLTGNTGSISYIDSNALTLTSITGTGVIDIATLSDDLTIGNNITTTDTTSVSSSGSAITLNAGKSEAAGTSTGGDIIYSAGTLSVGSGGGITLFTGSSSGSTGLANLATDATYLILNKDESTQPTYGSNGVYAIYRENVATSTNLDTTDIVASTQNIQSIVVIPVSAGATQTISFMRSPDIERKVPVVSRVVDKRPTTRLSLTKVKEAIAEADGVDVASVTEVRVPLGQRYNIDLVNGGISLPSGLEQEFYVVEPQSLTDLENNDEGAI